MATRFCPSPTGYLHIGNVRTALFNYLLAERAGVPFLLRLEDTDRQRCKGEYEEALREDLLWLGLNWQGEPWRQSERSDIYSQYTEQLRAAGHLYPCFCSDEELQVQRKLALAAGRPPRYPGTCRALGEGEVADRLAAGEAHAWRFRVPQGRELEVTDLVRATYSLNVDLIGDFVLVRRDGDPTFLFCNALDDALAGVEMVVRGEDHISNTPKQLLLFEALGMRPPAYGHLAVLTGADNKPLSKRDGSSAVRLLREEGYLPSALLNQVVRLGHKVTDKALLDFRAMAAQTDLGSMSRSPSIWQRDGLKHWQKLAVEAMTDADLAAWIAPHLPQLPEGVDVSQVAHLLRPNLLFAAEAEQWVRALFGDDLHWSDSDRETLGQAGSGFFAEALACWAQFDGDWAGFVAALGERSGQKGRQLFMPLRLAISGQRHGPELDQMAALMGAERVEQRLRRAAELLAN